MQQKSKEESVFFCTVCGHESKKWMGQCPACHSWNSFSEEKITKTVSAQGTSGSRKKLDPIELSDIENYSEVRIGTGYSEFDRVLGGGIVPGSIILIGGEPGIGKSTILLQTAENISASGSKVIYISGEESLGQIKMRAERTGRGNYSTGFVSAVCIEDIINMLETEKPDLCIIDSIQTMYSDSVSSAAGSVTQVRECAQQMMMCCKSLGISAFLVGHVTKEGMVAGPRVLEHIVDTVLYFESGSQGSYRIIRSAKNRFGSTNEIGVFEMGEKGLSEVKNPSEYLLDGRPENATGACVTALIEGSRPMLLEVQALTAETQFGNARRQTNGFDYNRLNMLLAVLEKRCGLYMSRYDVYVNIAGGMHINEPSADLSVAAACISSFKNIVIPQKTVIFGEIGLSGEIRAVAQASERIKEAKSLGFDRAIVPQLSIKNIHEVEGIEVQGIRYLSELFSVL